MLLSEFERLTGTYPDAMLYEVIEKEYIEGDWSDKNQFCCRYGNDVDGLATKCQRLANEKLTRLYEGEAKLKNTIRVLEARLHEAAEENDRLEDDLDTTSRTMQSMQQDDLKIRMLDALMDAADGDATAEMILHMVFGFEYLLDGAKEVK